MMRRVVPLLVLLSVTHAAHSDGVDLQTYARRMETIQRGGMIALGSWAVANAVANGAILAVEGDSAFATMNLGWAGINLGLATVGLLATPSSSDSPRLEAVLSRQRGLENAFLFNAGLDVGYVFAGLWLRELALRSNREEQLRGFGTAIVMQGAFLFAFDLVMFIVHSNHARGLYTALPE